MFNSTGTWEGQENNPLIGMTILDTVSGYILLNWLMAPLKLGLHIRISTNPFDGRQRFKYQKILISSFGR